MKFDIKPVFHFIKLIELRINCNFCGIFYLHVSQYFVSLGNKNVVKTVMLHV